jgi:hypothetical protein
MPYRDELYLRRSHRYTILTELLARPPHTQMTLILLRDRSKEKPLPAPRPCRDARREKKRNTGRSPRPDAPARTAQGRRRHRGCANQCSYSLGRTQDGRFRLARPPLFEPPGCRDSPPPSHHAAVLTQSSGLGTTTSLTGTLPMRRSRPNSLREGRSAMFAFERTYSNQTDVRAPEFHA